MRKKALLFFFVANRRWFCYVMFVKSLTVYIYQYNTKHQKCWEHHKICEIVQQACSVTLLAKGGFKKAMASQASNANYEGKRYSNSKKSIGYASYCRLKKISQSGFNLDIQYAAKETSWLTCCFAYNSITHRRHVKQFNTEWEGRYHSEVRRAISQQKQMHHVVKISNCKPALCFKLSACVPSGRPICML